MKLTMARSELIDALSIVSKGVSARSTLPILSGVLVASEEGQVRMQSTDLEVSIRHSSPALTEKDGAIVLPGRLLTDIVRSLPEAAVTIEVEGERAHVRCQQSSFSVKTLSPADFPSFPEVKAEHSVELPAAVMASLVRKVSKAVSRDETRAILTGVLLVIEKSIVKMVATDSYRMALAEVFLDEATEATLEVVVPGRALEEAVKLATPFERVKLGVSDNQVVFDFGSTTFVTRRIEGSFPNYKQLIPPRGDDDTVVTVSAEELSAAVKRVSLLAMHNTPLRVSVNVEDQTLSLSATTQDVGDASEDVMVKAEGKDVEIAFNHAYMADGLSSVGTENLTLRVVSSLKPGLLEAGEGEDFKYLLMPVRLS